MLRLVYSKTVTPESKHLKLDSLPRRPLRAHLSTLSPMAAKAERLRNHNPEAAVVVERLIDDFLRQG